MIDRRLQHQLDRVASRLRQLRIWTALAGVFFLSTLAGGILLWLSHFRGVHFTHSAISLAIVAVWAATVSLILVLRPTRNYRSVADRIERHHPELDCALLTAVEQQPALPHGQFGYLQQQVMHQVLLHGHRKPWPLVVPTSRLVLARIATLLSGLMLVLTIAVLFSNQPPALESNTATQVAKVTHANARFDVTVEPGDTQVEKNTGLLILARFAQAVPPETMLVYETSDGESHRLPMAQTLDDPVFGTRIPSVKDALRYHVEFAGQKSDDYKVGVFTFPEMERADALLNYPSYTGMQDKLVQDVRHVSAVEGTELKLLCYLNKAVDSAVLVDKEGESIELSVDAETNTLYTASLTLQQTRRLELRLRDQQGRENRYPPQFVINVLPNRPPDLKLVVPTRDVQVSPLEELDVAANAWDDFGLERIGVNFSMPGAADHDVVLGETLAAKQRVPVEHTVYFEELRAEPDQLLAYYFWAEDTGPDGNVRRVSSDMYFAEVRHFEEIFRQGQQPTAEQQRQQQQQQQQGQGGNAQQAQQLAELQKQIINGTWKLIRRELSNPSSDHSASDTALLLESQQSALEKLEELAEKIQDAESAAHVQEVRQHMQSATSELESATSLAEAGDEAANPVEASRLLRVPLQSALSAEQAAYQSLLKLRAREHEVVRSQQSQQGQSQSSQQNSNSRSQQQLQQMELQKDENRYEQQRLAESQQPQQQSQADRENRQVLNRLRELARRQNDLNERIKQLQSELQAAQQEQEREEIERQLKRLRDEQQEILRDSDELKSRMEQPENQERMAQERQQLDRAREQARRSSEALQEGMVSQAAASGTRAENELNELRDEFRRRASTRFDEQMRDMKREARQIDETQEDLAERLGELDDPDRGSRSLRDSDQRSEIQQSLEDQQNRVGQLLDGIEEVVEQANEAEPLLAEQLYDIYRRTQQKGVAEALRSTERSVDRGMVDDAQLQERVAREGIRDLRKGIDRAAESVLGDETEALRRAKQELQRLSDQLDDEIARNDPARRPGEQADNAAPENQPGGQTGPNQPPQGADRQNENQDGRRSNPSDPTDSQENQGQGGRPDRQSNERQPRPQQDESQNGPSNQRGQNRPGDAQQQGQPRDNLSQEQSPQQGNNRGQQPPQSPNGENRPQQPGQNGRQPQAGQQPGQQDGRQGPRRLTDSPQRGPRQPPQTTRGGADDRPFSPIAGGDFLDWSDRLRDVEEMIDDPELRAEAARIRDRARGIRKDIKRHAQEPNWDLVRTKVFGPLLELQQQVDQELLRRTATDSLVPIDRDPVPPKYAEQVRLYYERLGRGR